MATWADGTSTGRTGAALETSVRDYTDDKTHVFTLEMYGGGTAATAAENVTAYNSAKAAAVALNAMEHAAIRFGPGTYLFNDTLTLPTSTTSTDGTSLAFIGSGKGTTVLERTTDAILIDATGTHPTTTTTTRCRRFQMRDLSIDGGGSGFTTTPVFRSWYAEKCNFDNIEFRECYSTATYFLEHWDSWFTNCFWNNCGGRDGSSPAVYLRQTDGTLSGAGHSSGTNVNNIWFTQCRWEQWRDGALWSEGAGTDFNQLNRLVNCKFENSTSNGGMREHSLRFHRTRYSGLTSCDFIASARDATTTPAATACVSVGGTRSFFMKNVNMRMISGAGNTEIDSFILLDSTFGGGNTGAELNVHFISNSATDKPVTACIKFTGTANTFIKLDHIVPVANSGSMTMYSGAPDSQISGDGLLLKAGAPSDADFPGSAGLSGMMALDTTNSRLYVRVGSTWKYAALT